MAKDRTDKEIKELEKELEIKREQVEQAALTLMETRTQLRWTQTELLKHLTQTNAGSQVVQPPNYDSPDFDERLNKQVDDDTISKGIVSRVYRGRYVAIQLMGNGAIELRQQSHHLTHGKAGYVPLHQTLSQETFFLILEAMEFAEKKFGLDRKAAIEKLTSGGDIVFKEAIALI